MDSIEINKSLLAKIRCQKVGDKYYIFINESPKMITNEVGYNIVTELQSGKSIIETVNYLQIEYKHNDEDIRQDVVEFIRVLKGIIE